ncbi:monodehydroascorbate reductase [Zychaea mexicana]|uniref:monodehydroascorbate reductase n=1 Tax=Zychaea mexicana TaxID=64656 RepID=UPI0022FED37F|nr:monodehydroascorbate reductase [Zychaea mexicana]KAI9490076.1 monodehydroascorbate reductase [Zychaea mexicana]
MSENDSANKRARVNNRVLAAREDELKDMERKEVKVDDETSFMLTRLGGKYYATSGKCTHYGAPLMKGTLASDGRIMCAWHGACFNVKSADIEDAPALDSLQRFDVSVENGNVYVTVSEEQLKNFRRHPHCAKHDPKNKETVVIIGGGASAAAAAQKLREENFRGRIKIVSREDYYPVDRIKITKQYAIESADSISLRPKEFWDDINIEFLLGTDATSVDLEEHSVTLQDGQQWKYDHLILATGGWPKKLGIPGADLQNVFTIRTVETNQKVAQAIKEVSEKVGRKPRLGIIGSSFIGMELASAVTQQDAAQVTVISTTKYPFTAVLGEHIGEALMKLHESKGVRFVNEANVQELNPKKEDEHAVGFVNLEGKDPVPVDVVVMAVGVQPQTDYLQKSNEKNSSSSGKTVPLADDKGVLVDRCFKVVGTDNVYATGDIATFPYQHTGEQLRIEHWGYAENTGRTVALNIAKKQEHKFTHVPYFWTVHFGTTLRYSGFAKQFDRVIVQGNTTDVENYSFVGYYVKNDEVLAICSYMKDPIVSHCAELLRIGKMPKGSEIDKGVNPLDIPHIVD